MNHIGALSGGKDSTAMALALEEFEPEKEFQWVFTPTGDELPDMIEHWRKLGEMLRGPLIPLTTGISLQGEIRRQNALPNWRMRWCTRMLKIEPFNAYLKEHSPCVSYVGLRADEPVSKDDYNGTGKVKVRKGMDLGGVEGVEQCFPLREWGWNIGDVWNYLDSKGISIPPRTDCARCFFQRVAEWWNLWAYYPDHYAAAEADEERTGHTFRSPGGHKDKYPVALKDLRAEFEKGVVPKGAGQLALMDTRENMCRACSL